MESQPQNPEFWNNPEYFHPCDCFCRIDFPAKSSTKPVSCKSMLSCIDRNTSEANINSAETGYCLLTWLQAIIWSLFLYGPRTVISLVLSSGIPIS